MVFNYSANHLQLQKISVSVLVVLSALLCALSLQAQTGDPSSPTRYVAVTFDDLPGTRGDYPVLKHINDRLIETLKAEKIPAIGFVNEAKLQSGHEALLRTALLRQWLDNGQDLGNHSFSHILIDRATLDQYEKDVIRGETVIKKLLAERERSLKYYRHTQLRTGPTEEYRQQLAQFLKGRGYTVAPVTIDNNDYIFADAYSWAKERGDRAMQKNIVSEYVSYMQSVFDHFEKLSVEFLGYEVRQTLLLHANEINADHFDKLVKMLRGRGYTFISLDEALKDKAYQLPEAQSKRGLSWLHRWMMAKGLPIKEEPLQPDWINKLAQNRNR